DVVGDRVAPGQPVREPAVRLRVDEVVGFGAGRDPGRDVGEAVHADRAERRGQLLVRGAEGLELAAVDVEATGYGVAVEDLQDRSTVEGVGVVQAELREHRRPDV